MLGNIGNQLVKYMRQVTKGHLYQLLEVSDYCVMLLCIGRRPSQFCETSPNATIGYLIPVYVSVILCGKFEVRGREF